MKTLLTLLCTLCLALDIPSRPTDTFTIPGDPVGVPPSNQTIDLGGKTVTGVRLPRPKWDTTTKTFGNVPQLINSYCQGEVTIANGRIGNLVGAAIKTQATAAAFTIRDVHFFSIGSDQTFPRPGETPPEGRIDSAVLLVTAKRITLDGVRFTGCCQSGKWSNVMYLSSDLVRMRNCSFTDCGRFGQSPNLLTPTSRPQWVVEDCEFQAGEWTTDGVTWKPSDWFWRTDYVISMNRCKFSGRFATMLGYLNPSSCVFADNDYSQATFADPGAAVNMVVGGAPNWCSLDAWVAQGKDIQAKR